MITALLRIFMSLLSYKKHWGVYSARDEFQKKGRGSILTETYFLDIIRQGWTNDDERLQRVVLG